MESRFDISAGELKMKLEAKCIKEEKVEDIPKLTLAPFTNNTKLFFENSLIGTTSIQQLIIENPTTQDVKVAIKNMPPSEKRVQLSWEVQNIPACAAVLWEITWMPDIVDSWRHTFSFQFGRCLKKDLPVTFKSVANKKQVNPKNRSSVKVPTRHSSVTAPHCSINNKKVNGSSYVTSISKKSTVRAQKENIPKVVYSNLNEDDVFLPSKYTSFTLESFNSEIRRETYTVKERQCSNDHNISVDSIDMCLENNKYYGTASDTLALKVKDLVFSPLGDSKYLANLSTATYTKENRLNSASSLSELGQRIYSTSSIEEELHNISTATYTKDSLHSKYNPIEDLHNISSGTYTKERQPAFSLNDSNLTNISTATYTKEKYLYSISPNADSLKGISSETYTKEALSTEKSKVMNGIIKQSSPICTKKSVWFSESLLGSHENDNIPSGFNFSPISFDTPNVHQKNMSGMGVRTIIEANLWGCENVSGYITNDALITKPLKRKSELNFEISPAKRVHINGQLSNEPHNLNWNTSKPPRVKVKSDGFYFDPYMVQSVYQDEAWMERQEGIFKNWLNALLAPPSELDVNVEVNVAKIWQESKQKGESAPTPLSKESVSSTYHTNHRLDALRKSASELFRSQAVGKVIATTYQIIENQKLSIRQDKNIHLNLGLQSQITLVLLNYNPLWLRIGLETLFNTIIPISSNSDVMGLHNYIMQNLFKSSFLLQKFKSAHSPKYVAAIQKFILKKLFALVYFLDVAKTTTLIPHDPCLFSKTSPIKESREVVLTFSRELLSSVGDITKVLRLNGYILNHKQKYIHEFDYCVNHLGADLRDGVRLTRVMELILLKTGLTDLLRVPAVSRLQKIHNMKGVFDALTDAGFEILGDISPKDIVDGHHEKTLSFLWQIIYKFQAPVMVKAANTIIKWWRSLQIVVKRRIIQKRRHRLDTAAICIQTWYRRLTLAWKIEQLVPVVKQILLERLCNNSALKIQALYKMYAQRKHYLAMKKAVLVLQRFTRSCLLGKRAQIKRGSVLKIQTYFRMWICRRNFLNMRSAAITIQQRYHGKVVMLQQRSNFLNLKVAVINVQRRFKANKLMKIQREEFLLLKSAVITVQLHVRALILMKHEKQNYDKIRTAVITIQKYFRGYQTMKKQYCQYQKLRYSAIVIQTKFRAYHLMKLECAKFCQLKEVVRIVQQRFRANKLMQNEYSSYQRVRQAALVIQKRFRANRAMKKDYAAFNKMKRAAIVIQTYFRAHKDMKIQRTSYVTLQREVINIQRRFIANKLMKYHRSSFLRQRAAVIKMQRIRRATNLMRIEKDHFTKLRNAAIIIQTRYRSNKQMKLCRAKFLSLIASTSLIQNRFRAHRSMKIEQKRYESLKNATICIQRHFRAVQLMKVEKQKYVLLKKAVISIQRRYKANKLTELYSLQFSNLKLAVLRVQLRFRANRAMREDRLKYLQLKKTVVMCQAVYRGQIERRSYLRYRNAVITVQTHFRARLLMKVQQERFRELQRAAVVIQRRYRGRVLMKKGMLEFHIERKAVLVIQRAFRAHLLMKIDYSKYQNLKMSVVKIQQRFRAWKAMREERKHYLTLKKCATFVQSKYRAKKLRDEFNTLKNTTICIQIQFRANRLRKQEMSRYAELKNATISIQRRFRANRLMRIVHEEYTNLKGATICIQRKLKATLLMRRERDTFTMLRNAAMVCQTVYRATQAMRVEREKYIILRSKVVFIQRIFRANRVMKRDSGRYVTLKKAAIMIQTKFRANKAKQLQYSKYHRYRNIIIRIQRRFRANREIKRQRERLLNMTKAAVTIQRGFRRTQIAKVERARFMETRNAAIMIQRRWRLFLEVNRDLITLKRRQLKAVVLIQACWRGHVVRKNRPEVADIRRKIKKVTSNALSEDTLSQRRERAIQILTDHTTLLHISRALDDFDFITRRCKNTLLAMSRELPEYLYITITTTNRSPGEMEVCTTATSILINFCKYSETTNLAWKPSYMAAVFSALTHCCDKEDKLFPYLCTLIWLFAHNNEYKNYIQLLPKFKQIIAKIESLCLRKQKMVSLKSHKIPSLFHVSAKFYKPSLVPDWGLDYPNRPRTFTNSIHALHNLLKILD